MEKPNFLHKLAAQLTESLPEQFTAFKKDFEKSCQRTLNKAFAKLDVVTREEFESQSKVLARTRKKLESLQEQVAEMEKLLQKKKGKNE